MIIARFLVSFGRSAWLHRGILAGASLMLALASNAQAAELIMVRQTGCSWCALWDREIGPIYPVSDEGRFAPLRHIDLRAPLPSFITKPVTVTPTFILVEDDREIGRITGYPGETFFWGMLSEIFELSSFGQNKPS
ncbi:hypothetical protein [Hyphomicrobium zavarzinii]|jgi:hypothetical protein|nr:hypothetical protein [Hyphomicrobium zavarzinii]